MLWGVTFTLAKRAGPSEFTIGITSGKKNVLKFQLAIVNSLNAAKGYSVLYVIIVSEFALHFFAEISKESKIFTRDS